MVINIIDRDFNFLGQIDEYESFIPSKSWHGIGGFELHLHEDTNHADMLQKENIIALSKEEKSVEPAGSDMEITEDWQGFHEGTIVENGELHLIDKNIWRDGSGGGNDGALNNFNHDENSGWVDDGLKFDGIDDRMPHNRVDTGEDWTIDFIAKFPNETSGVWMDLFGTGGTRAICMHPNGGLSWYAACEDNRSYLIYSHKLLGRDIPTNELVHFSIRCEYLGNHRANITFNINDIKVEQSNIELNQSYEGFSTNSVAPNRLGKWTLNSYKVYNRKLTDTEIKENRKGNYSKDGLLLDLNPNTMPIKGLYISNAMDISEVGVAENSMVTWLGEGVIVESNISTDGGATWSIWEEVQGNITKISNGTNLSGARLQYRITLDRKIADEPYISNLITSIETKDVERIKTVIDAKKAYIILYKQASSKDGKLIIKGLEIKSYLARWLVFPPSGYANYRVNSNVETIIKEYVTSTLQRKGITNIVVAENLNRGITTVYQSRYKNLADELEKLSLASNLSWDIALDLDNKRFIFDVVEGRDVTVNQDILPPAIFAIEYDNIAEQTLVDSKLDYRNTAIVAGQGEGVDRAITVVGEEEGFDSFETFVDARDVENDNDLPSRGEQRLSETQEILTFDSQVLTDKNLIYEEDFKLGDIVTIQNNKWNITTNRRITEITEIYESTGFRLDVAFGESLPTILDIVKKATEWHREI